MAVRSGTLTYEGGSRLGYLDVPWANARPDLDLWLPTWVRCAVRCSAHRSRDGQPCQAWAVRGGSVCVAHGGAAPQVRLAAQRRLAIEAWERGYFRLVARVVSGDLSHA